MSFTTSDPRTQKFLEIGSGTFEADVLSVFFESERSIIEEVIPPGLNMRGEPYVQLVLNDFTKTDFTRPYKEGVILICVTDTRTGIDGVYPLALTLDAYSGDIGAFAGRDFGFPKKLGHVDSNYEGDSYTAFVARHGICYASFSGDFSQEPNDKDLFKASEQFSKVVSKENPTVATFCYVWPIAVRNILKPRLSPLWCGASPSAAPRFGFAHANLTWSAHDPWASLPVKKILGASVMSGLVTLDAAEDRFQTEIDPDAYRPYSFAAWDHAPSSRASR